MSDNGGRPLFQSGRDQHIAYAEQGDAIVHVNVANAELPQGIDIAAELRALKETIAHLTSQSSPSVTLLDSAEKAAALPVPRREEVASLVEGATKLAGGANGFADQADKLIPRLQAIGTWAGRAWDAWGPSLGL